ncbi:MAG: hypothetical protein GWO24_04070, partial [Akkermansiaceae bacterium]|nr:hypothetical protein [Akkermansiaceae bacterium]
MSFIDDPEFEPLVADAYSVPDWKVIGFQTSNDPLVLPGDVKIESYALEVTVKRLPNHYIVKVIAPLLLIVLLSWVVFWLDPSEGGSQLG